MRVSEKFKPVIVGVTALIWILVAAKYFGWFHWSPKDTNEIASIDSAKSVKVRTNDFILPSIINDPFQPTKKNEKPLHKLKQPHVHQAPEKTITKTYSRNTSTKPTELARDSIQYKGYIAKTPGGHAKALINLNGRDLILTEGEASHEYLLMSANKDSIQLKQIESNTVSIHHLKF